MKRGIRKKELKKRIPLKYIYVLSACIAILLSVGLYYTYAMFTANVSSGNVVNMDTTLNYNFDISGTQSFHIGKNSLASFYATINNTSNGTIYYEIYYSSSNDLTNVIIGEVVEDPTGANRPVLAEGMIPITYDGTNWVKADVYGAYNNWYDYGNQKWANAVMVTSAKRETYMNADIGTIVAESDILAYYVWIPRYKYKLFNTTYASGTTPQLIDIVFESGTSKTGTVSCSYSAVGAETCTNKANGNYYTHPAFTFGDTELSGIWVGKFETTGSTTSPTIKPGITSLTNTTVSSMYNSAMLFKTTAYLTTTGIQNTDSHMMKNIEWGAVAYLKQSIYGLGLTDIGINSSGNSYYTGGGSGTSYKTNTGQSTTGNITGVYDMSGGVDEYVMGNYKKTAGDSGLTVSNVPSQYIDVYAGDSVSYSHLGDALGEVVGWYEDDCTRFVYSIYPWFRRGGYEGFNSSGAGVFSFNYLNGGAKGSGSGFTNYGFRVVLSVKK